MVTRNIRELSFQDAPKIVTCLPGPKSRSFLDRQLKLEGMAVSYPKAIPISLQTGRGATVMDMDGNIFIDFFGGAGVLNVGHCNPDVVEAIKNQVEILTHSLDFPTKPRSDLIEQMLSLAPEGLRDKSKILFGGPTGSDAVEASVKLARLNTGRHGLIAFQGSYHGMTSGALSLSSAKKFKENYVPLVPEVHFVPYAYCYRCSFGLEYPDCGLRCTSFLEQILSDPHSGVVDPAAVIIEPVQGEGGSITPPRGYIREVRKITEKYSTLLISDEIQAGLGRTGKMWSCEHDGVTPDIMTISKGIGGGLPLSAIQYKSELDTWRPGIHIGTFRGHVLAMAAGTAALKFATENRLAEHAATVGSRMLKRLVEAEEERRYIGEARGLGLMIGIEFVKDKSTKKPWPEIASDIRTECYKRGLIVEIGGHYNNVIRFLPPLVVTEELADRGLDIFMDAVQYLEKRS